MFFFIASTFISPAASAATLNRNMASRVVVAEDKTQEAGCVRWINTPNNTTPCVPGTVIVSRETTYAEVLRSGIIDYVLLTGNVVKDNQLQNNLVERIHTKAQLSQGQPVTTQACTPHATTTIGTSSTL